MEREVSSTVSLAVVLVALAALISIVSATLYIGYDVEEVAYMEGVEIQERIDSSLFSSLTPDEEIIVPKATVYNILVQESDLIGSVELTDKHGETIVVQPGNSRWDAILKSSGTRIKEYISSYDIIAEDLSGKVTFSVSEQPSGTYAVYVTEI